jgi:multidrug efflux pump subunit AcrA (membrane-fusion protein)
MLLQEIPKKEDILAVPQIAVFGDQDKYIYTMKEGKVEKKTVEVGLRNLEKVEVKGLDPGTKVIVGPFTMLRQLKPGMAVTSQKNKPQGGKK